MQFSSWVGHVSKSSKQKENNIRLSLSHGRPLHQLLSRPTVDFFMIMTVMIMNESVINGDFYYCDALIARYMLWPCVCPSVYPSDTSRCSTKTVERRITQTAPHNNTTFHICIFDA